MTGISFNKKSFLRTLFLFLFLTTAWSIVSITTDEFTDKDKGLITGSGFLILLSASIFWGQKLKRLDVFVWITTLTISTFVISSFILAPLVGFTTDSMVIYAVVNSLFVSIIMTIWLNRFIQIEFKSLTIALTFLFLFVAYFAKEKVSEKLYLNYDIHPRITLFNIFQFALLLPLALGMTLKKPAHNIALAQAGRDI